MTSLKRVSFAILILTFFSGPLAASGTGGLRFTVMVKKFDNKTSWRGDYDLGDSWRSAMTAALDESGSFIVVGEADMREAALEEQTFGASGATKLGSKTPTRGQMTPAQLLVKGEITHYRRDASDQKGGVDLGLVRLGGGKATTEIHATIYMIDSATGMVVGSKNVKGVATAKSRSISVRHKEGQANLGQDNAGSPMDAMHAAVKEAIQWMIGRLPSVIWRGEVLMVKGDGLVVVNRGSREGVQEGWTFQVGDYEILRDPDTGEVLDVSINERAQVRAVQVKDKVSICKVVEGNPALLIKGMGLIRL